MWLGNVRAYLEAYTKADDLRHVELKFVMDVSCLEQNLLRAVKLGEELLYDTILEHPEIILKRIRQSRMELEKGFVTSGNSYASGLRPHTICRKERQGNAITEFTIISS